MEGHCLYFEYFAHFFRFLSVHFSTCINLLSQIADTTNKDAPQDTRTLAKSAGCMGGMS